MILVNCSLLAWFITGILWRWSSDTQFAVGSLVPSGKTDEEWKGITTADASLYQVKSGNFMYYYYLISLISSVSICYIICCVVGCLGYGKFSASARYQ